MRSGTGAASNTKYKKADDVKYTMDRLKTQSADDMVNKELTARRRARAREKVTRENGPSDEEFGTSGTTTLFRTSPDMQKCGAERKLQFRGAKLDDFDPAKREFVSKPVKIEPKDGVKPEIKEEHKGADKMPISFYRPELGR
jgi:hypothetical protein